MKLAIVSHYFESHRGGIEIVAGALARAIAGLGHQVAWIATEVTPPPADAAGVATCAIPACNIAERRLGIPYPLPTARGLAALFREIGRADAVMIHDALYPTSITGFLAARWHGKPVVVVGHVGAVPYRNLVLRFAMTMANRLIARPILAHADRVAFISEVTAGYFATVRFRAPPELIFTGVDADLFTRPTDAEAKAQIRRRLGLPEDRPVALFVGRFVEKKGLSILRRMAELRPDIVWAFAGWGPLDPTCWGLANVRVFSGLSGAALAPLYQASDAFVLPSTGEGLPLVIQEATACGLPVVCGAETATADPALRPFVAAVPVEGRPVNEVAGEFCAAVDRVLAEPSIASAQRQRFAEQRYSWPAAAAQYVELIRPLLDAANAQNRPAQAAAGPRAR